MSKRKRLRVNSNDTVEPDVYADDQKVVAFGNEAGNTTTQKVYNENEAESATHQKGIKENTTDNATDLFTPSQNQSAVKERGTVSAIDSNNASAGSDKSVQLYLSPSTIRFSQDTIEYKFKNGKELKETLDELKAEKITAEKVERITVVDIEGTYFTRDNRRLCVFQKYEDHLNRKLMIPVNVGTDKDLGRGRLTTTKYGKSVEIIQKDNKQGKKRSMGEKWKCPYRYKDK